MNFRDIVKRNIQFFIVLVLTCEFLHSTPLFTPKLPFYIQYGHLGFAIAHELTHALDVEENPRENRPYKWNLLERFADNATKDIYNEKKQCFIDLYSKFKDEASGLNLSGKKTQREDIADNGGMKLALRTYRKLATQLVEPEPLLPQLEQYSQEQLFMISSANLFCKITDPSKRFVLIAYDEHTLNDFRVRGVMMNSNDFSEIFSCNNDDPMNPEQKCEVW